MKELGVSERLGTLMEGESLLNDGTAIVVFGVFYARMLETYKVCNAKALGTLCLFCDRYLFFIDLCMCCRWQRDGDAVLSSGSWGRVAGSYHGVVAAEVALPCVQRPSDRSDTHRAGCMYVSR